MTAKHTLTPWVVFDIINSLTILPAIREDDDPAEPQSENGGFDIAHLYGADAEANAEFIVRACNSHDQLVAALKDAKALLELNGIDLGDAADYGNGEHAYQVVRRIHETLAAAGAV